MLMNEVRGEMLLRKLPPRVLETLSPDQIASIRRAAADVPSRRHPIDTRISFRLPWLGPVYLVLLIGKEKRSRQRRVNERELRPKDRIGRMVLFLLVLSGFVLAALIGILFENAISSR